MKHKIKLWEYLVVINADDNKLNELGVNGWELVNIVYIPYSSSKGVQTFSMMKFYFKKQILV